MEISGIWVIVRLIEKEKVAVFFALVLSPTSFYLSVMGILLYLET